MNELAWEVTLRDSHENVLQRVIAALKDEGFGVLTRIDAHQVFKQKLDKDIDPYTILGACNPPLAFRALSSRGDAGLMLPCNVVVEATGDGGTLVRIANPAAMMQAGGLAGDAVLQEVGDEAGARLKRVVKSLAA